MVERRRVLGWIAVAGLAPVVGCGQDSSATTGGASGTGGTGNTATGGTGTGGTGTGGKGGVAGAGGTTSTSSAECSAIPEETAGPYPGDGTNGANALSLTGIVRSDITSSLAGASGVADGVPMTLTLTVIDVANGCAPIAGAAVYVWHCDRTGGYSMYSPSVVNENYLRGVQEADAGGEVTFQTIFPGCYSGRWPHIHFEIYPSLAAATNGTNAVTTSQLALPEAQCGEVYSTPGYEQSLANLPLTSLEQDLVFSDGAGLQLAKVSGSVATGYTATLTIAIHA